MIAGRPEAGGEPAHGQGWRWRQDGGRAIVVLGGEWIARDAVRLEQAPSLPPGTVEIAFEQDGLGHWDSALLVFVAALRDAARACGVTFDGQALPPAVTRLLALAADRPAAEAPPAARIGLAEHAGKGAIAAWDEALAVTALIGDTCLRVPALVRGRVRMRPSDLLTCVHEAGGAALPIVTIVNVLVGGILAFVGAVQLRRFGAEIYIAALVGVAMVREMAALMTAIVMAGRTGGAYAAHIATMEGNEEIDALRAIGIPVYDYLVLPRVVALTLTMPLLYLYGCAVGIFGGFAVSIMMLNLSPEAFIEQTRLSVAGDQILFGLVKSIAFGMLIALAGCRSGLRAGRSAADVGRAATGAVVTGIVGVIALDAVFAVCAHALNF